MKSNRKINKKIIVFSIFSLFFLSIVLQTPNVTALSPTFASYGGNQPVSYIAYIVENTQNTATVANLPITLTVKANIYANYFASDLTNVNWQDGNGNILKSYVEGPHTNTTSSVRYWINVGNLTINANSYIIIYQVLYNPTINVYDGVNTGAYPLWNLTYGVYDNGEEVFGNYWNFAGDTLPSPFVDGYYGWNLGSYTVDDGLTITGGSNFEAIGTTTTYNPQESTLDIYGYFNRLHGGNSAYHTAGWNAMGTPAYILADYSSTTNYDLYNYNTGAAYTEITGGSTSSNQIWSLYTTTTTSYLSLNYGSAISLSSQFSPDTSQGVSFSAKTTSDYTYIQYCRVRVSPPNNVMPTVTVYGLTELYGTIYQSGFDEGYDAGYEDGHNIIVVDENNTATVKVIFPGTQGIFSMGEFSSVSFANSLVVNNGVTLRPDYISTAGLALFAIMSMLLTLLSRMNRLNFAVGLSLTIFSIAAIIIDTPYTPWIQIVMGSIGLVCFARATLHLRTTQLAETKNQ